MPLITQNKFFSGDHVTFHQEDMRYLRTLFPQGKQFDLIVSFEGIEHILEADLFLKECVRLLKPSGKLIISTPRKPHGSPHHPIEYSLEEYETLLRKYFTIDQMNGQIYTDIFDVTSREVNPHSYHRFNYIAVCSRTKD